MLVCSANYLFPIKFKAKFANELLQRISTTREGTRVGFKILQKCSELDVHTLRGKEIERKKNMVISPIAIFVRLSMYLFRGHHRVQINDLRIVICGLNLSFRRSL